MNSYVSWDIKIDFCSIYVEKISHTNCILLALDFLAEINLNLVKISILVSMTTMETTGLLGTFQLLILEGY